jgi:hypothetical protein
MNKKYLWALAVAGAFLVNHSIAAVHFAVRVVDYDPGVNYAAGYTNTESVIGDISRVNPFGDAVEPFNPPYGQQQVLSIGEGGSLTIEFDQPIRNDRRNTFGIDFMIFGNSGFIITNDFDLLTFTWIGIPATDGSLFGANQGTTRVSVSRDGRRFYELSSAPTVDVLFPTDGAGDPSVPVNPALSTGDFAGATLADIRSLYGGSAGGAGYDISSARDNHGRPHVLSWIRFVRVEVLSGKAEIDAFSSVVPR